MVKALIFLIAGILHPVHVTMVSLVYDANSNRLEFFGKIYAADLAFEMGKTDAFDDHLVLNDDVRFDNEEVMTYLNKKLIVTSGKYRLPIYVDTVSRQEHEVIIRGHYIVIGKQKELKVVNTLLTDMYDDQENLFIFSSEAEERSVRFSGDRNEGLFRLK